MATTMPVSRIDPVLRALDEAPEGEPLTPEQEAECAARAEELRSGRVKGRTQEEVRRALERMRAQQGA
jgi:hypothetical protein